MKRLILMRHAKSDWSSGGADHQRPLNKRGRKSAKALGDWLRAQGLVPDQALCSSATRTRETLDLLDVHATTRHEDRLYHAGPVAMLKCLNEAEGDTVIMVGHNPGIAEFADELMAEPPRHPRFADYPTGATLVAEFEIDDWAQLQPATGRAAAFVIPRELLEESEA
ncbi:histidine phosphatase family protein [Salipiger bermudensis]|uniref:SixA phosphatase family protein n=1 Tax=Salipiger bermudensis TaxID=344736 RepID=UPI001C9A29A7|nr:histidine phosphatase family protein [Salipiger bermudensis]MBY6002771.1 histidine phosphatase family protein [Salipiger bermudensis]